MVRDRQRSQRLQLRLGMRAGPYQSVGANPGWDDQVTAHYHIDGQMALLRPSPVGGRGAR